MRALLSWSSGKDSAWALHVLQQRGVEVIGLLTTLNGAADRVAMHGTPRVLVAAQASAAGLPLRTVDLPWPCSNEAYEARLAEALAASRAEGATHVAYGDLFLADVRVYRERTTRAAGLEPLFPLWAPPGGTPALARTMLAGGLRAVVTCVDPQRVPATLVGQPFDEALLDGLPPEADPCGENGEFHTFCTACPAFSRPVSVSVRGSVERDGFHFADLVAAC